MADSAGVTVSDIALTTLFADCVDCLDYVQLGHKFGSDYEKCQLKLDLVKLRLSRWGDSVCINGDPSARLCAAVTSSEDQETVKRLLSRICMLFENAENEAARSQQLAEPDERELFAPQESVTLRDFHKFIQTLSNRRQKRTTWVKKVKWVLHEKEQLDDIIRDITHRVNELISLFPAAQASQQICEVQICEISTLANMQDMTMLQHASSDVDKLMESVLRQISNDASGHAYKGLQMGEQSKLTMGNLYINNQDQPGLASQSRHSYQNIMVLGGATVLLGDQYGGKGFWD